MNKFGLDDHIIHNNIKENYYKEHLFGLAYFVNMINKEKGDYYLKKLNEIKWEASN